MVRPGQLHFGSVHFNPATSMQAIVTKISKEMGLPHLELCILFELMKPNNIGRGLYQAMCQALLASMVSPNTAPVVVLTDLQEYWRLFWVDKDEMKAGSCESRGEANLACAADLNTPGCRACVCSMVVRGGMLLEL